jgi:hypothetical protein
VLVADRKLDEVPEAVKSYRGRVFVLDGGFASWKAFALTPPKPPDANADAATRADYALRAGLNKALTGKPAPPPPAVRGFVAPVKKKGGGCAG